MANPKSWDEARRRAAEYEYVQRQRDYERAHEQAMMNQASTGGTGDPRIWYQRSYVGGGTSLPEYQPVARPPLAKAFVAGPIVAWRLWKAKDDGALWSVAMGKEWPAGTPMVGNVVSAGETGIYGVKTREHLTGHSYGEECLVGTVALWGKVIEHERGYRAQYGYPVMVCLSEAPPMPGFPVSARRSRLAEAIRDRYGCEVR